MGRGEDEAELGTEEATDRREEVESMRKKEEEEGEDGQGDKRKDDTAALIGVGGGARAGAREAG